MAWEFKCIVADTIFSDFHGQLSHREKKLFMLYLLNSQRCSSIRFSAWSTSVLLESNFLFLWRWKLQRFARTIWPFVSQFPVSLTSFPTNGYSLSISKNTIDQNSPQKSHFKIFRSFTKLESFMAFFSYFGAKIHSNKWFKFGKSHFWRENSNSIFKLWIGIM